MSFSAKKIKTMLLALADAQRVHEGRRDHNAAYLELSGKLLTSEQREAIQQIIVQESLIIADFVELEVDLKIMFRQEAEKMEE